MCELGKSIKLIVSSHLFPLAQLNILNLLNTLTILNISSKLNMENDIHKFKIDNKDIIIRPFQPSDSISEITELLHLSYKKLADMGFRYFATHQDEEETDKRLNKGYSFIAKSADKIIATITVYFPIKESNGAKHYKTENVANFGQFAVHPDLQSNGIGNFLMDLIENKARSLGAEEIALDTAEGALHLIKYYKKRGYRFIEYVNWSVTNYRSVIMSKSLSNL